MHWETEHFGRILMGRPSPTHPHPSSECRSTMNDLMRLHFWGCFSRRCPSALQIFHPKSSLLVFPIPAMATVDLFSQVIHSHARTGGEGGADEDQSVGWTAQAGAQGWPESKGKQLEPTNLRGREKNAAGGLHEGFQFLPEQEGGRLDN